MQQLDIADVMIKAGDILLADSAVQAFCSENMAKALTVQVGEVLPDEQPTEENAPYIAILDGDSKEGAEVNPCQYSMSLIIGVKSESRNLVETEAGSVVHEGYSLLSEFMTLIKKTLNNYRQISQMESRILGAASPDGTHWVGTMDLTWEIEQVIGYNQEF